MSIDEPSKFSFVYRVSKAWWFNFDKETCGHTQKFHFVEKTDLLAKDLVKAMSKDEKDPSMRDQVKDFLLSYIDGHSFEHLRQVCKTRNYPIGRDALYELVGEIAEKRKDGRGPWLWYKKQHADAI